MTTTELIFYALSEGLVTQPGHGSSADSAPGDATIAGEVAAAHRRSTADRCFDPARSLGSLSRARSREPGFPLTRESKASGLTKRSWIKISQIRTLLVDRIGERMARASEEELARVVDGLNEIVG